MPSSTSYILEYPPHSRIECKFTYSGVDVVSRGFIIVRDARDAVRRRIALIPENIDRWIDVTRVVMRAERGIVEARFARNVGRGSWHAILYLRATSDCETLQAQGTEHPRFQDIAPTVLFRKLGMSPYFGCRSSSS